MNRVAKEKSHPGTAIGKWKNKWNLVINSLTFSTVTKPELRWIRWKKRQGINGNPSCQTTPELGLSSPAKGRLEKARTDLHKITPKTGRGQPAGRRLDRIKRTKN